MVYTLGESLLDIIITNPDDVVVRPGGAMLNTAVSLGRRNIDVSLITELGDDNTAQLIINFLNDNKVITKSIQSYDNNNTSLALAFLDDQKKPSYTFIKNYPTNRHFINIPKFKKDDILLFGSIYSLDKQIRPAVLSIIENAVLAKATIIYDPNIRHSHHLEDTELLDSVYQNIRIATVVKGSDEDFTNIFGIDDTYEQIDRIRKINNEALIIVTLGKDGLVADFHGRKYKYSAINTNVVSTIGAGDAFNAGFIYELSKQNIKLEPAIEILLQGGLKFSSIVCGTMDNYVPMEN